MRPANPIAPTHVDLLIIGGGVNGAGIARDAAGRGLSVMLVEQDDLASHTSSASTKLIHGGLRYLEQYEFRLVREALVERERLLAIAPHIIWPLAFVLPHQDAIRPAWLVRLGLFLYDHIGGRKRLAATRSVRLDRSPLGAPLSSSVKRGFVYSDCWVEDSRLVVLNAMDAAERGATIRTRTRFVGARREDGLWRAELSDGDGVHAIVSRAIVNAAGPWVSHVLDQLPARGDHKVRLIKGSHIVVPRLYDGEQAYLLQNDDRRVIFAIPYEHDFTLIGTTDELWTQDPGPAAISPGEIDYLITAVSRYFKTPPGREDVVWSYAGIRPLREDEAASASEVTRDYVLDLDAGVGEAPLLSVFGGKITTYRRLAEEALAKLAPLLGYPRAGWTDKTALPGGDLPDGDFEGFVTRMAQERPWMPAPLLRRLCRAYGSRLEVLLGGAANLSDLGPDFGAGLYRAEVDYLVAHEYARTAQDVLFRRTKLGLRLNPAQVRALENRLAELGALPDGVKTP